MLQNRLLLSWGCQFLVWVFPSGVTLVGHLFPPYPTNCISSFIPFGHLLFLSGSSMSSMFQPTFSLSFIFVQTISVWPLTSSVRYLSLCVHLMCLFLIPSILVTLKANINILIAILCLVQWRSSPAAASIMFCNLSFSSLSFWVFFFICAWSIT